MKNFTMITRHGASKDNIVAYTLIGSDYGTTTVDAVSLAKAMSEGRINVTNLKLGAKGIESSNGAMDKYTFINTNTNQVEGTARAVVLDRVEQNGKLVGYTIFTQNGTIAEVNTVDAAALANAGLISNGKVRHSHEGDVVSAIGGTYPLRTIDIAKAPKGEISVSILYFGTVCGTPAEYVGAIVSCTSATEMSKITDVVSKSNAKVIADEVKVAGQSVRESLAIKRMGVNSVYGVFEIEVLDKLLKAAKHVHNEVGDITVSAVKYDDGNVYEATVKLNKQWKVTSNDMDEAETTEKIKKYTKKIVGKFSGVSFE